MTKFTKTKPSLVLAIVLPLGVLGGAVMAQDVMIDPAIDVNGDGTYSFVELNNLYPELEADAFTMMDTNGDGVLDLSEVTAATEAGKMPVATE